MHDLSLPSPTHPHAGAPTPRRLWALAALRRFQAGDKFHLAALGAVLVLAALVHLLAGWQLESRRAALLESARAEESTLDADQRRFLSNAQRWIVESASADWEGDLVAAELSEPGAFGASLGQTSVYLRGVQQELEREDAVARAARTSNKDATVLCLLHPPASDDGADLLQAVRRFYLRGALFEDATARVRPMHEAVTGLRPLGRQWSDEARAADAALWIRRLEMELYGRTRAQIAASRTAASARHLLVVVDELPEGIPPPRPAPSITDSQRESILPLVEERPHEARLVLVDLHTDRVLLRVRRRLDASTLGVPNHSLYTAGLQGCQLATGARAAVDSARATSQR